MFLTLDELRGMTRAVYAPKICKALEHLGIPYKPGVDGYPVVLRSAVEQSFTPAAASSPRKWKPDFTKLRSDHGTKKDQGRRST